MIRALGALSSILAFSGCAPVDNPDLRTVRTLLSAERRLVVIGEIHGTREGPAHFTRLVTALSSRRHPPNVGIELPDQVVRDGCAPRRAEVLAYWASVRDGRTSVAMRDMLCELKRLEQSRRIRLFGFVEDRRGDGPRHFAPVYENLRAGQRAIILVGNYHARRAPESLVQALADRGVDLTTLTMSSARPGSAWTCDQSGRCETRPLSADFCRIDAARATIRLTPPQAHADGFPWDGCVVFPSLTASPPAVSAPIEGPR